MSPPLILKSNDPRDVPDAYQIGWVPFLGCTIHLDSCPLIPRTETEWWTEHAIAEIKKKTTPRVLDLFAGSGCVGVAVLKHVPSATVDFGELEARHLPTIEKNIHENEIDPTRTRVVLTDVYSDLRNHYDFVLANPPYLSRARIDRIEKSVLEYEPAGALFAEDDGFDLIRRTIEGAPERLTAGGQLWIEHEPEHAVRIHESALRLGLTATVHKDQYGVERYAVILKP